MINDKRISSLLNSVLSVFLLISLFDTFTYSGFVFKHLSFVVAVAFSLVALIAYLFFLKLFNTKFLRNISFSLVVLFVMLYFVSSLLEELIYTNFIFSHSHLHPSILLLSTILVSCIFLLNGDRKKVYFYIWFLPFLILGQYIFADFDVIKKKPVFVAQNARLDYDKKMEILIEKLPYDYIMFIKANTPEKSSILLPPQSFPWEKTSNIAYLRYFLFPRMLINGNEKDPKIELENVDFVLIDYGETYESQYGHTNGWPKFDIESEYIIYWDPKTNETWQDKTGIYKYDPNVITEKWGLIKI